MFFSRIIATIFCLSAIFTATALSAADDVTADNVEIVFEGGQFERAALLLHIKATDALLTRMFRTPKMRQSGRYRLLFSDAPGEVVRGEKNARGIYTAHMGPLPSDFAGNFDFQKRLQGALILPKLGIFPEEKLFEMPDWITVSLLARMQAAKGAEKILRQNRYLPGLRALLDADSLPDFREITQMKSLHAGGIVRLFYQDYCRFILELAYNHSKPPENPLARYLILTYENRPEAMDMTLTRLFLDRAAKLAEANGDVPDEMSREELLQYFFRLYGESMAFNHSHPYSGAQALKKLREFRKITYNEIGRDGKPTGKKLEADIMQLPRLFSTHPEGKQIKQRKLSEFLRLRGGLSSLATPQANRILKELSTAQDSLFTDSKAAINYELLQLEIVLTRQHKIELFMLETERKNFSWPLIYKLELEVLNEYNQPLLTERMRDFLLHSEKEFTGE